MKSGQRLKRKTWQVFQMQNFYDKHGILEKHQQAMTNIKQLAKLFYVLGFPIDEKLLEEIQNEK